MEAQVVSLCARAGLPPHLAPRAAELQRMLAAKGGVGETVLLVSSHLSPVAPPDSLHLVPFSCQPSPANLLLTSFFCHLSPAIILLTSFSCLTSNATFLLTSFS